MDYDTYWNGDVWMIVAYNKAERRRKERVNSEMHLQGMYFYEALCDASPLFSAFARKGTKPHPYRTEPYNLFGTEKVLSEEEEQKKEENERIMAKLYMSQMMRVGKNWGNK